ncbi:uncharacterized protein C21orf62-like [Neoarius graeffei]|uniref:uncharacterized protein C21orf62-like n=1 Tax=Neoarius graeffei TaxID=443677 RepID=UPI00298CECEA|nr:uncharacterized protein C21orf62-like [Neoarius graeffei]XP_060784592.1 uncharacterized protein C21orf62-like [Neoarius graeffei]
MDEKMLLCVLQHILCILLLLHFVETQHPLQANITLVFDSSDRADRLCSCSCATAVRSCDEALANLMCSCGTVWRSALSPGTLEAETLTVWVWQPWVLRELLNGSRVPELQLSLCSPVSVLEPSQYLTIVGLRKLQISNNGVLQHKGERVLNIGLNTQDGNLRVAFLDLWSLNNHLKAYSVIGPPLQMLLQHFPSLQQASIKITEIEEIHKPSILTFIY